MADYVFIVRITSKVLVWGGYLEDEQFNQRLFQQSASIDEAVVSMKEEVKRRSESEEEVRVYVSLPSSYFFYRLLKFPKAAVRKIDKVLSFEIEKEIPVDIEEVETRYFSLREENDIVYLGVFVIRKEKLYSILEALRRNNFCVDAIVPEPFLLYSAMKDYSAISIKMEKGDNFVLAGTPEFLEIYNFLGNEYEDISFYLNIVRKSIEARWGVIPERLFFIGKSEGFSTNKEEKVTILKDETWLFNGWSKVIAGDVEYPQFAKEEYMSPTRTARWKMFYTTALLFVVFFLLISLIADIMEYMSFKRVYQVNKEKVEAIFKETFPDVRNIVDPVLQMKERLNKLKLEKRESAGRAIDLLYILGSEIKKIDGMRIERFVYEGSNMRIEGSAKAVSDIDKLQKALEDRRFKEVSLVNTRKNPKGEYEFKMAVKLL